MTALARYDAMLTAIAECARVDEVKDIRDRAMALQAYYRQARNLEAEREAANVRLRAECRTGELLKELARSDHGDRKSKKSVSDDRTLIEQSAYALALKTNRMSRQTAGRYQALASIPGDDFERALSGPDLPTANGMIRAAAPQPRVNDDALWLWGRLRDFENRGYFDSRPADLFAAMTDAMCADVLRLAPLLADFLRDLETAHEPA